MRTQKNLYTNSLRYDRENFSSVLRSYNTPVVLCDTLGPSQSDSVI